MARDIWRLRDAQNAVIKSGSHDNVVPDVVLPRGYGSFEQLENEMFPDYNNLVQFVGDMERRDGVAKRLKAITKEEEEIQNKNDDMRHRLAMIGVNMHATIDITTPKGKHWISDVVRSQSIRDDRNYQSVKDIEAVDARRLKRSKKKSRQSIEESNERLRDLSFDVAGVGQSVDDFGSMVQEYMVERAENGSQAAKLDRYDPLRIHDDRTTVKALRKIRSQHPEVFGEIKNVTQLKKPELQALMRERLDAYEHQ